MCSAHEAGFVRQGQNIFLFVTLDKTEHVERSSTKNTFFRRMNLNGKARTEQPSLGAMDRQSETTMNRVSLCICSAITRNVQEFFVAQACISFVEACFHNRPQHFSLLERDVAGLSWATGNYFLDNNSIRNVRPRRIGMRRDSTPLF